MICRRNRVFGFGAALDDLILSLITIICLVIVSHFLGM